MSMRPRITHSLAAVAGALLLAAPARAQTAADSAAVRAAVLDYVDAIYRNDTARVARSVRPGLAKRGVYRTQDGSYREAPMTYAQLVEVARTWNRDRRVDVSRAPREVRLLDVLDHIASARLAASWGVDYFHLAKGADGRWMIVNVLWQSPPTR
jgi:hypothetical protein